MLNNATPWSLRRRGVEPAQPMFFWQDFAHEPQGRSALRTRTAQNLLVLGGGSFARTMFFSLGRIKECFEVLHGVATRTEKISVTHLDKALGQNIVINLKPA